MPVMSLEIKKELTQCTSFTRIGQPVYIMMDLIVVKDKYLGRRILIKTSKTSRKE